MNQTAAEALEAAREYGLLGTLSNELAKYAYGLNGVHQDVNFTWVAILGFAMVALIVATMIYHWIKMARSHLRFLLTTGDKGAQRYWAQNHTTWWPAIKRHLLYAPLFRNRHNRELQLSKAIGMGTLPGRFHTLILFFYTVTNIVYCLTIDWKAFPSQAVLADIRGRSGWLSLINIVPTVLFALRNNPLITILGVSYDTFNLLHRWIARMMVFQAIVHTVAWLVNTSTAGGTAAIGMALNASVSYKWGMVGTVVFTFLVIVASSPIRHAWYETFINGHRLMVLVGLIGVWVHIQAAGLPQLPYLRAVFAMWGGEWAIRVYRIWYNNISMRTGVTKVTVEALPAEASRVTFTLSRPWHFKPGCHAHIYLPSISGHASHPFSIAWAETTVKTAAAELDVEKSGSDSKMQSVDATTTVSFVCRARTGMTRKLYDKASASPTGIITMKGGIEGPYGGHESMSSYGTVLLFGGGVGVTYCISYLKQLLTEYAEGTCSTRKILFVWSVPNTEALEWVRPWMDQVLRMEGRKEILRIQLFVTKPRHQNEIRSHTGTVQMFPGRCNPTTIIEKEMQDRVGAMGITVCGPGAFADSVRAAARSKVEAGTVDFIEEAFTY
ncbi:putative FRE ferric reductase-like transmembrane component [Myriangium duriaei CBS 260.36]|uniref:FRE ferric reductase-like transmembrane component n=1 Tax=Myriangium duriaei CBS 260.36 TaxID=1168546 RepID=A0A9P4MD16_9PEZI|nr:putative FRE ferric reductase-like transmembrane component [Myriangium duriaei CBS 260.36]